MIHKVGISINSGISKIQETWDANILDPNKDYSTKIDYNSTTHNLSIIFMGYKDDVPTNQYLYYPIDLRDHLLERVIVGFSAIRGWSSKLHTLKSWSLDSTSQIKENAPSPVPTIANSPIPTLSLRNLPPPLKKRSKIGLCLKLVHLNKPFAALCSLLYFIHLLFCFVY